MLKSFIHYCDSLDHIYHSIRSGDMITGLSHLADTITENNQEKTISAFSLFTLAYYNRSREYISYPKSDKFSLEDLYDVPYQNLLNLIEDNRFKEYILNLIQGIESYSKMDYIEATDSFELMCEFSYPYEAPHYFLAIISIHEKDHDNFSDHFRALFSKID